MAPWWVCGLLPLLAVAAAAAVEGNAEPLIRSPAQDEQDSAPAPAPSAEKEATRRTLLAAGSFGYETWRHQAGNREPLHDIAPSPAPSAEKGVTRRAVSVADSFGYDICRQQPGNREPLHDTVPAPAPSAEERVTRAVLVAGYSCYRHQAADLCTSSCVRRAYQIRKRRGMNQESILVCMGKDMARNPQNPRRGVIITAEGNTEPLILLPTQNEHDAAPAPAPSVEDSSGYENYRHQADVCHAYQILKRGGLKEETILVCMYDDDMAKPPQNPRPGVIIIISEENTEPLILLATQNGHVAAPAPSAEERIPRADPSGYWNYRHQILKRGGMNDERIMVCMYDAIAKNFQNPRPGVIVAAERNTEPLHDAAPAPAPSVEDSPGYENYRHKVRLSLLLCMRLNLVTSENLMAWLW
ncbi:hypothetical protein ACQ4PT_071529 [Festuca glaucescens]